MNWIDADTACALLGVKPQTLYAYVSRNQLRAKTDRADGRRSLYAQADIDHLLTQRRRPRARAEVAQQAIRWGDPVLTTSISEVRDGMLWIRGRPVADCAEAMTLEQMAGHLWGLPCAVNVADDPNAPNCTPLTYLAQQDETAPPMSQQTPDQMARAGATHLSGVTSAWIGQPSDDPVHLRLACALGLDPAGADAIRRALVLLADHELNPSTFAVRVCASTGASLPATLLAGMATLSGPNHGGAADLARQALLAEMVGQSDRFLADHVHQSPYTFGFGHPLYPQGDPRARLMLDRLDPTQPPSRALRALAARMGAPPNVDGGLAALTLCHDAPPGAPGMIFAIGRLTGWIAHAMEQSQSGGIIRPRARYVSEVNDRS